MTSDLPAPQRSHESLTGSAGGHLLIQRIRFLAAMAVAATLFWYVGWWATRPIDPLGPITLLLVDQGVIAMAELLGLAVVAGGLAVAICGVGSADRGPLAVAVGLASLGLRGGRLDDLVLYRLNAPETQAAVDPFPTWALVSETWLWLALIGVGFVVGQWVVGWFNGQWQNKPHADFSPDVREGLGCLAVTGLIAWVLVFVTAGDLAVEALKGQVYFSVGFSFLVGSLVSSALFPRSTRIWALLAVALVAAAAYSFGGPDAAREAAAVQSGRHLLLAPIARILPIEYAAVGAIGVLFEKDAMRMVRALFGFGDPEQ